MLAVSSSAKSKLGKSKTSLSSSEDAFSSGQEKDSGKDTSLNSCLQKLSTDRQVEYLKFDLAYGLFDILRFVDEIIRQRRKSSTKRTSGQHGMKKNISSSSQLWMAGCIVQ